MLNFSFVNWPSKTNFITVIGKSSCIYVAKDNTRLEYLYYFNHGQRTEYIDGKVVEKQHQVLL
jgi:hypothetical protein